MLILIFVTIALPAENDGKLSLGVTIFLSQIVMVMVISEYVPVQSIVQPFCSKLMLIILITMTCYMVVNVLVVSIYAYARKITTLHGF